MFSSKLFTLVSLLTFLALVAVIVFQIMEMNYYECVPFLGTLF